MQSAVMILRILRDLQSWSPIWKPLRPFALELIVEKSLASVGLPLSPGDALRRVFEAISSGCVLNGSPGLLDPCEKDATDALDNLSNQQKEDLTSHAQRSLRLLAFRQIHQVLRMDPLPVNKFSSKARKRSSMHAASNNSNDNDAEAATDAPDNVNGEPSAAKIAKKL